MDYVKPFLIGGTVIAGAKVVSDYSSPAFAPIIGGMPTGIIASYFLISEKEREKYFKGYIYSTTLIFFAILFVRVAMEYSKLPINYLSTFSLIMWFILSYFAINYFEVSGKKK